MLKRAQITNHHSKCDECGFMYRTRSLIEYQGKMLCFKCRNQKYTYKLNNQICASLQRNKKYTLKEAVEKEYKVASWVDKEGHIRCQVVLPPCFVGKKIKVAVVYDKGGDN
jgi:ABC-type dipeptide/oligopeptide/nickel transport system ATPase component